ncbi:MAG: T9SS type A sorting domain-containing protein [Saprospiraceae bacterium]
MRFHLRLPPRHLFLVFFLLSSLAALRSQACLDTFIILRTQKAIDDFPVNYPGCTSINGTLKIVAEFSSITNLHGLSSIQTIKGDLIIVQCLNLQTLDGLEQLDSIYGDLDIELNDELIDVGAIGNVQFIGGKLDFYQNSNLQSIDTFHLLTTLSSLKLYYNNQLTDVSGFHQIRKISNGLSIIGNLMLKDLEPFQNLDTVGGLLFISTNDSLLHLTGLRNLKYVGQSLNIHNNPQLLDLTGLENLKTIEGNLKITSNTRLSSIDALTDINADSIEFLTLSGNSVLSICNTPFICDLINGMESLPDIRDNAPGCNTFFELYSACGLSVDCLPGLIFRKQSEIDQFPILFPDCHEIQGNVVINANENEPITNLDGLLQLNKIFGSLEISGTSLEDLNGLQNLNTLEGYIDLSGNDSLLTLNGLENLTVVQGIYIDNHDFLNSLQGLHNIHHVLGSVNIEYNKSLSNLIGLDNLEIVNGDFSITRMESLEGVSNLDSVYGNFILFSDNIQDLSGFESLQYIGGLHIQDNDHLRSLEGLNVDQIGGLVQILSNPSLQQLTGLDNVHTILGELIISGNDSLIDLTSLSNLSTIGGLNIKLNKILKNLDGLQNLHEINGPLYLWKNAGLTSLEGLENITRINGELNILEHDKLTSITPLSSLEKLNGGLRCEDNPLLESFGGMVLLDSIHGDLSVRDCPKITMDGLQGLKIVTGNFLIINNDGMKSFAGLESLESIQNLNISENAALLNIDQLNTLKQINGEIRISQNPNLTRLATFSNIKSIPDDLDISSNDKLSSLGGLDNLTYVGGDLSLGYSIVNNFSGLHSLKEINGNFFIYGNSRLEDLNSLNNLNKINGFLWISNNNKLTDISGIQNIDPSSIKYDFNYAIRIDENNLLSDCSVLPVCEKLSNPSTSYYITDNQEGCNSRFQILANCEFTNACLEGDVILSRQTQIDSFPYYFPVCDFYKGSMTIKERTAGDIQNLTGLTQIKAISGNLSILDNAALISLAGLDSLHELGGSIFINRNLSLTDLSPLKNIDAKTLNTNYFNVQHFQIIDNPNLSGCSIEPICQTLTVPSAKYTIAGNSQMCENPEMVIEFCDLPHTCDPGTFYVQKNVDQFPIKYPKCTTIGGDFNIIDLSSDPVIDLTPLSQLTAVDGEIRIQAYELESLDGLENITQINGDIRLYDNPLLKDIQAIRNIDPASVKLDRYHLEIAWNPVLSECAIDNICTLLESENTITHISNNGPKCNTREEILTECLVSNAQPELGEGLTIYPNPTSGELYFKTEDEKSLQMITLYDFTGSRIFHQPYHNSISIDGLADGIYTIVFMTKDNELFVKRVVLSKW